MLQQQLRPRGCGKCKKVICALNTALAYGNSEVVQRFAEDFNLTLAQAEEIFTETKRWLWLCARQAELRKAGQPVPATLPLLSEINAIDQMWHTFILFTQDYANFCHQHFGFFVHHTPQSAAEKQRRRALSPQEAQALREQVLRPAYEFIYDELGPEVLTRWCEEFPSRHVL